MLVGYCRGAMYVTVENENIERTPVELGNSILYPGQYLNKLGHKKRSMFEMQHGFFLKYIGKLDNIILFNTNTGEETRDMYYAFIYIDKNTLLIQSGERSFFDIKIDNVSIFKNVPLKYIPRQLSFM